MFWWICHLLLQRWQIVVFFYLLNIAYNAIKILRRKKLARNHFLSKATTNSLIVRMLSTDEGCSWFTYAFAINEIRQCWWLVRLIHSLFMNIRNMNFNIVYLCNVPTNEDITINVSITGLSEIALCPFLEVEIKLLKMLNTFCYYWTHKLKNS
jgi:hypothetical protein